MKIYLFIFFSTLMLSCHSSSEAEEILDKGIIAGIDFELRKTKDDLNFTKSNQLLKPIFRVFKDEMLSESTDFSKTIECLDTLLNHDGPQETYADSLYQTLLMSEISLVQKKQNIAQLLHLIFFLNSYHGFYCSTEKIDIVLSDTIYYPRNRTLTVKQVLTHVSSDTLHKKGIVSFEHYKDSNVKEISTFTSMDHLKIPLHIDLRNPVTTKISKYIDTLVVAVID